MQITVRIYMMAAKPTADVLDITFPWALLGKILPFVSGEQIIYSCICRYRWLRLTDIRKTDEKTLKLVH